MLLSRYVFSLAAFGLGLVTAELLNPALPVSFSRRATQQHRRGVRGAFFPLSSLRVWHFFLFLANPVLSTSAPAMISAYSLARTVSTSNSKTISRPRANKLQTGHFATAQSLRMTIARKSAWQSTQRIIQKLSLRMDTKIMAARGDAAAPQIAQGWRIRKSGRNAAGTRQMNHSVRGTASVESCICEGGRRLVARSL